MTLKRFIATSLILLGTAGGCSDPYKPTEENFRRALQTSLNDRPECFWFYVPSMPAKNQRRCSNSLAAGDGNLFSGSPCVDVIEPSDDTPLFDYYGTARPVGDKLDCGAHELLPIEM